MNLPLPLEGLYLYLVRAGFPLSARDYQDALHALQRGYGTPRREDLRWLCETLWARNEQEASRLDRLFREFPWPSADEVQQLTGDSAQRLRGPTTSAAHPRPRRPPPADPAASQSPAVEFASPSQSGVGLPRAVVPEAGGEIYIFSPRPLLSLRSLIIAFRRFRITQRAGRRLELDLTATIDEQCRRGTLVAPVLVPARRNQARLVVLVDASASMVTWRHMNGLITEALGNCQLAHTALYFFDNSPAEDLYELDTLGRAVDLATAHSRHPDCAVLIVSDAGAARGRVSRERIRQLRAFLAASKQTWRPMTWLNPMPQPRWSGTTAAQIAKWVPMFEFTEDGLIRAVDVLRGKFAA